MSERLRLQSLRLLPLLLGLLLAGGAASAAQLLAAGGSSVREIVLSAPRERVSAETIRSRVSAALEAQGEQSLAELDLAVIRDALLVTPWVAQVSVRRQWPDRLVVKLREHQPVAMLPDDRVLTASGAVVAVEPVPGLPRLEVAAADAKQAWHTWQGMAASFDDGPLAPEVLRRDATGQWQVRTQGGVWLRLGSGDPLARMEWLKRAVAPALAGRMERVAYIDLRYGNGFAVGWRDAAPESE